MVTTSTADGDTVGGTYSCTHSRLPSGFLRHQYTTWLSSDWPRDYVAPTPSSRHLAFTHNNCYEKLYNTIAGTAYARYENHQDKRHADFLDGSAFAG